MGIIGALKKKKKIFAATKLIDNSIRLNIWFMFKMTINIFC